MLRQQDDGPSTMDVPVPAGGSTETAEFTEEYVPDQEAAGADMAAPSAISATTSGFLDGGMVGTVPFGAAPDLRHTLRPHAYTDGGMTGTVAWSGGGGAGAHANQNSGSIQTQVPPTFAASPGPAAGRFSSRVNAGTGLVAVTRSWLGAFAGDQANGWWLSANAVARINQHERVHVASTRAIYNTNLAPLEARIANAALGQNAGAAALTAIIVHRAAIRWAASITAFQNADVAANQPGGTTDTSDVATGWISDLGPGTVAGTAFTNRIVRAGEAAPAP